MPQLIYGVWDNVVYDNRGTAAPTAPEDLPLELFDQFNEGNPTEIFLSNRGFLVFSRTASLVWALWKHHQRLAAESCGKCSPCRAGSPILAQELEKACRGELVQWEEVRDITEQMHETSLCGVGRTGTTPLLDALTHFPDELRPFPLHSDAGFYSVTTSPCIEACPSHVNVPRYIDYLQDGHNDLAAGVVLNHYPLAGSCGRVCVRYCEKACRRGQVDAPVDIKNLKRFAADETIVPGILKPEPCPTTKNKRVAVIGAGPVGVTCAYQLLETGYPVDIYEAHDKAGGMVRYGIPFYRLPKNVLMQENELVKDMGGMFFFNQKLGRDFHIDDLFRRGYKAVFIATGCPLGGYLGMEGEDTSLPAYENGIDFLEKVHDALEDGETPTLDGDVVVVGGGNVAMDCCRTAVRAGAEEVSVVYRRRIADMTALSAEIESAIAEGVEMITLQAPAAIEKDERGRCTALLTNPQMIGPVKRGRPAPVAADKPQMRIPADIVLIAVGQNIVSASFEEFGMAAEWGEFKADAQLHAQMDADKLAERGADAGTGANVFVGGDCQTGPATVIKAIAAGKVAARNIDDMLGFSHTLNCGVSAPAPAPNDRAAYGRVEVLERPARERKHDFEGVEVPMSTEEAMQECGRCLRCDHFGAGACEGGRIQYA